MFKRKLGIVFSIMLIFSLISYVLISAYGREPLNAEEENKIIVTSFYPVYIITGNLTQGIEGIQVENLTENHTGCLHDYQLTTKDMLMLERADILILNGGEMELFITAAVSGLPELPVIDSCEGMDFLMGEEHHHEDAGQIDEAENGLSPNGHVWMDMNRYQEQIRTIADALCRMDPENAAIYRRNEENYRGRVLALQEEYEAVLAALTGTEVILFHDAFYYLCDELGMEVIHGIDLDADTALSAGEIAEITDEIQIHGINYLLAEEATGAIAEQIAGANGCQVIYLDPLTSGAADNDAYLEGMRNNMEILSRIAADIDKSNRKE